MRRTVARYTFRSALLLALAFATLCAVLVRRQQNTLWTLLHPGEAPVTTEVYGAWTELTADNSLTKGKVLAVLKTLDYLPIRGGPVVPGTYAEGGPEIALFCRGFLYPDGMQPPEQVRLRFGGGRLVAVEDDAGKARHPRLEPKRLAEWSSPGSRRRLQIQLKDLPSFVPASIVAVEDKRFYRHGAFDGIGIARALWVDLRYGHLRQGASTISQQLARSIFLDVNRTIRRKIIEGALAFYLELRFQKAQLIEMYLNQVYWGKDGAQSLLGIESASRAYFGKSARTLTLAESATLAGLLESPNRLSPRRDPDAAVARRNVVLRLMQDQGLASASDVQAALHEPLRLAAVQGRAGAAAYFLATLQDQLADRYSLPQLLTQGWRIFTTLDPVLQAAAEAAVAPLASRKAPAPQAALVAINASDGAVVAWVGGTNYQTSPFDRALYASRQPGSAFKPFVVLAALESHQATTATLLADSPLTVRTAGKNWRPQNYDRHYLGNVALWDCLIQSRNVPMVRLAQQIGIAAVADAAHRAGINSLLRPVPSLALGTSEVSLYELTSAYGTLASGGLRAVPYTLRAIVAADGRVVDAHPPVSVSRVFSVGATALVTQMLEKVLDEGTAKAARKMGFLWPAAGKTGTAENYQDAWFVGYSPRLVCGVWVGYDQPKSLGQAAASTALPIWIRFMDPALALDPPSAFAAPPELIWKTIDPTTGALVRSGCPRRRSAAFLPGTEPKQLCPLHPGGLLGFFKRLTS